MSDQPKSGQFGFSLRSMFVFSTIVGVVIGSAACLASICRDATPGGLLGWTASTVAAVVMLAVAVPRPKQKLPFIFRFILAASFMFSLQFFTAMLWAGKGSQTGQQFVEWTTAVVFGLVGLLAALLLAKSAI